MSCLLPSAKRIGKRKKPNPNKQKPLVFSVSLIFSGFAPHFFFLLNKYVQGKLSEMTVQVLAHC